MEGRAGSSAIEHQAMRNEGAPIRSFLRALPESRLLRSNNCRVAQQPDWRAFVMAVRWPNSRHDLAVRFKDLR
jgi:hypothetical protein